MKTLGIIPARYGSTRFPGKPLALIQGKPMIQHVYERVKQSGLDHVVVATDDERIEKCVKAFGGNVCLTESTHETGTSRCIEVAHLFPAYDIIVNIQGDEPLIHPSMIQEALFEILQLQQWEIATAYTTAEPQEVNNPNSVKVVVSNTSKKCLYFSRAAIPFHRDPLDSLPYFKHIGIYFYKRDVLMQLKHLSESILEKTEMLEQLRWLEHSISIHGIYTNYQPISVDTPDDVILVEKVLSKAEK